MDYMPEMFDEAAEKTTSQSDESKEHSAIKEIFDWLDIVVTSIIAVVIIFTFLFRLVTIVGDSMQNSFYSGEKIVITKLFYEPKYGDVVVVSRNANNNALETSTSAEPIIKRVIATEGQYVDINFETGKVYVGYDLADMVELDESYVKTPTNARADVEFPVYVDEGKVFVLGDNRNDSKDSRFKEIGEDGLIDEDYILGRAIFRLFPFDRIGKIDSLEGVLS